MEMQFNPDMLTLAREARGLSQTELAEDIGITQGKLSKYESGLLAVSREDLQDLCRVLNFPESFFRQPDRLTGCGSVCNFFRKRQSMGIRQLRKIQAETNLLRLQFKQLMYRAEIDSPLKLHRMDIADYDGGAEQIAQLVRASWNMPLGPIANLTEAVETVGGVVFQCDFGTNKVDAISNWSSGMPPLFFVNATAPADRKRYSLCHEIGHLIMHYVPTNNQEAEADRFASEFLMPAREIASELHDLTIPRLAALKQYWKVSMAALIRRAYDLEKISERSYRHLFTKLSALGYRKSEPSPLPEEKPRLVSDILQMYKSYHGYSNRELAALVHLTENEFVQRFKLDGASSGTTRPPLKLKMA
ncbi:Helix-turn-helix domain protein [Phycisphaerae bacterium RAS2]|nr:Helix-turn-helix domain protein [Phycisphaerae bacterium RAS2]